MSLGALSPLGFALGLVGLAGLLFFLQRLRTRFEPVVVSTTLFWRDAMQDARARVLTQRFRHPMAYLLVLLIAALMWLAFAQPRLEDGETAHEVVLLDASAAMSLNGRFDTAREAFEERVAAIPAHARHAVVCGATRSTVLRPDEPVELLARRLDEVQPAAVRSQLEEAIAAVVAQHDGERSLVVSWVGDGEVSDAFLADLPEGVRFERVALPARPAEVNRGITALGTSEAKSGRWDRVDVYLHVAGPDGGVSLALDGAPIAKTPEKQAVTDGFTYHVRDLPARGGVFRAVLAGGDAMALDDEAAVVLPRRPMIRVALDERASQLFAGVLAADPAVTVVNEGADVFIGRATSSLPSLLLTSPSTQQEAFLLTHEDGADSADVLATSVGRLGLDQIDTTETATALGQSLSIGARPSAGAPRSIGVWEALFAEKYNFTGSRSFPLFMAMALRWLVDARETPAVVRAGDPVIAPSLVMQDEQGDRLATASAVTVLPTAGVYRGEAGEVLAASLLETGTQTSAAFSEDAQEKVQADGNWHVASLLGMIILALLTIEWTLLRRGRMP